MVDADDVRPRRHRTGQSDLDRDWCDAFGVPCWTTTGPSTGPSSPTSSSTTLGAARLNAITHGPYRRRRSYGDSARPPGCGLHRAVPLFRAEHRRRSSSTRSGRCSGPTGDGAGDVVETEGSARPTLARDWPVRSANDERAHSPTASLERGHVGRLAREVDAAAEHEWARPWISSSSNHRSSRPATNPRRSRPSPRVCGRPALPDA